MARGERIAHRAGGDPPPGELERRHHVDREAVGRALRLEELRRAPALLAEMEVEADGGAADRQPFDQDVGDELLGGEPGERGVEGEHHRAVEPGRGQQPQLGGLGRKPE